jgi:hypothetical protein
MIQNLSNRDTAALLGAVGVKVGGGSWTTAFIFFVGSRLAMNYLGFPDEPTTLSPGAQSLIQAASGICQRIFGEAPPASYSQPAADSQAAYSQTIDADYQEIPG